MRFPQRLDQASSESIFGERGLESAFALQLFSQLGREVGFQKNLARIILLPKNDRSPQKKQQSN
jgi:hypothetical protein